MPSGHWVDCVKESCRSGWIGKDLKDLGTDCKILHSFLLGLRDKREVDFLFHQALMNLRTMLVIIKLSTVKISLEVF